MNGLRQGDTVSLVVAKDAGTFPLREEVDTNKHGDHEDKDHHQDCHADPKILASLGISLKVLVAAIHVFHLTFCLLNSLKVGSKVNACQELR